MITRGAKYFFGAALVGYLTALVYGFITGASAHGGVFEVFQSGSIVDSIVGPLSFGWKGWVGEHVGYSTLMAFAGTMLVLGGFCCAFRDGSPEALAELQGATVDRKAGTVSGADLRIPLPTGLSYWPLLTAFSLGAIVVGAAVSTPLVVIGAIGLVVAGFEWTVRAWSDRITGDPARNREIRDRLMHPIEVPVGATLAIALVVFCMSRILLAIPKVGSVFFIIIVATLVFVVAIVLASRPQLKRSVLVAVILLGGVAILAGGIAGGIAGPRESSEEEEHAAALEASLPALAGGSTEPGGAPAGH